MGCLGRLSATGNGLLRPRGLKGCPSTYAPAFCGVLAYPLGNQEVQRRHLPCPAVLVAIAAHASGLETQLRKRLSELPKHMWIGSDIERQVPVIGWSLWSEAALVADEVDHLPANEAPPRREDVRYLKQAQPGLTLAFRQVTEHHAHREETLSNASTWASSRTPS